MSKSRKRLIVRLSLVTVVVSLGVYALIQAQGNSRAASGETEDEKTDSPDGQSSLDSLHGDSESSQLPSPEASVVRGNDDDAPHGDGPEFLQVRGSQFSPAPIGTGLAQTESSKSGGRFGESAESSRQTAPALPPTQPPVSLRPASSPLPPPATPDFAAQRQASDENQFTETNQSVLQPPSRPVPSAEYSLSDDDSRSETESPNLAAPAALRPVPASGFTAEDDGFDNQRFGDARQSAMETENHGQNGAFQNPASAPLRRELQVHELREPAASSGSPGPAHLEGVRTPSLTLEKRVPGEIQVGKPAIFEIKVQNVGRVDAEQVTVFDQVPQGTRFVDASPTADRAPDGSLVWRLGTLQPGDEKTIALQLLPESEGEIGSVAQVSFATLASARTICTKPQLTLELAAAPRVLIGESLEVVIRVSNPGTGEATGVIIEEDIPDGLSHPAGSDLEFEVGSLLPGETRDVKLTLKAEKAGLIENLVIAHGDGNLTARDAAAVEVIAPGLSLATRGPNKRYLERQATYSISVANPGTAPANDVELVAYLHKGMKFIESNNQGQYDAQNHAVFWSLAELPASDQGTVQLTVLPIETGEQRLRVEGRASLGLADSVDHDIAVEGLAALFFDVADLADPIEIGSNTVYQVRVVNQGSKTDSNIRIVATLPPELELIGGEGPTAHQISGRQIVFAPLSRLAPQGDAVFKIQARGVREADPRVGDPKIKVQLTSDEIRSPVTKEESTRVYADR